MNSLFAQSKLIDVSTNFDLIEGQNVTSFIILDNAKEKFIENCFLYWKKPKDKSVGIIKWYNINIPSIGDSLIIKLLDGYSTKVGNYRRIDKFESKKKKEKMIKNMAIGQERFLSITIFNYEGESINWDTQKTKFMISYLTEFLK